MHSTQSAQNASNKHTQGSVPATHAAATTTAYNPNIDPANFVRKIDNPLLPLKPGTKNELQSKTSDGVGHETLTVTHDTQKIAGVTTTVIKDVSTLDGKLEEKTTDWYAQDKQGNVWSLSPRSPQRSTTSRTSASWRRGTSPEDWRTSSSRR
jgi:hypothetical protein